MSLQERSTQYTRALAGLRSEILKGAFTGEKRLRETEISEHLGVSRTPLRQAIERLVEEGLLERMETGGVRVASLRTDDILDAIELRGVLEGTAARLAAERGVSEDMLAEADRFVATLDRALAVTGVDFPVYVEANAEFHDLIARMPQSAIILREVERAKRLPVASPSAFLQGQETIPNFRASLIQAQEHHRAVVEAIRHREGARAEALMREHARLARQNLGYVMNEKPNLAARVPGLALITND